METNISTHYWKKVQTITIFYRFLKTPRDNLKKRKIDLLEKASISIYTTYMMYFKRLTQTSRIWV